VYTTTVNHSYKTGTEMTQSTTSYFTKSF
jgi:hypothetical protein